MYETRADYPTTAMEAQAVRVVESTEECLRCEKTLNHLAGRVVELRERLSNVLNAECSSRGE